MDIAEANNEHWERRFRTRAWGRYPAEKLVRFVGATCFDTGAVIEPGAIRDATIGPFAGTGIAHFFEEDELRALLAPIGNLTLDHVDRSRRGGTHQSVRMDRSAAQGGVRPMTAHRLRESA